MPEENSNKWTWDRLLAIWALLDAATQKLPDDQCLLLRFVVCAVAIYAAYNAKVQRELMWTWIMAVLAILFNPFIPIDLTADTWKIVDWICAGIMGISLKCHIGKIDTEPSTDKPNKDQRGPSDLIERTNEHIGQTNSNSVTKSESARAVTLNNEAVEAIDHLNYSLAIKKLEQAIMINPGFQLALENLASAYNHYGMHLSTISPKDAAAQFYRALLLCPNCETTLDNLDYIIKILDENLLDPRYSGSFDEHVRLADQLVRSGDHFAALGAYIQALKTRTDLHMDEGFYDTLKKASNDPKISIYMTNINSKSDVMKSHDEQHVMAG